MKISLFVICLLLAGCSFKKNQLENQTSKGHSELYSEPQASKTQKLDEFEKRIIIASTNDVHGIYQTQSLTFKDEHDKKLQSIKVGGIDAIESYFKILRDTYENVILVDSGDIFAKATSTNTVRDFYKTLKYNAITVGLSDFNLKLPSGVSTSADFFKKFAKTSSTPLLLSNLYELKTARVVEWEGTKPYVIKDFGGVKVGIMGVIPDDIVAQTPVNNRVGLFVESMVQSTLRNARLLRSLGADIIVVLTHQGIDCDTELARERKLPVTKVNFEPKKINSCDLKDSLGTYLERLPPQLVDVVIAGRNHLKTVNFINGTLVMSGFPDGRSFNYAEFTINTKTKKIQMDDTVVHQPVYFCHEFFKETKDCYTEDASVDHKERIPATFLGKPILITDKGETVSMIKTSEYLRPIDIAKNLVNFTADIAFAPESSGNTQLYIVAMNGKDLIRTLEEDYNRGVRSEWIPSPFMTKGNELKLTVGGLSINAQRNYRILMDLESLQTHPKLIKHMANSESQSFTNYSWNSYQDNNDMITSRLAAPRR